MSSRIFNHKNPFTIGVEEEYMICDPLTGELINRADEIMGSLENSLVERFSYELLLSEIEIGSHDIAISALKDDHASIAAVLLAIDMGVERTGLILYDADLVNVVRRMGITFSVDRKRVAIDSILARIHSELPGPYAVLSSVPDVIGICLPINADVKFAGKTILDAGLPEWCKVAFIQRQNIHDEWETMRPSSSKTLLEGDRLTIFLPPDRVDDLEKKFKV